MDLTQNILSAFPKFFGMLQKVRLNLIEFGDGIYELLKIHDGAETQQSAFRFDVNGGPKWKSSVTEKRKVWQISQALVMSSKSEVKANGQIEHKQQGHRVCRTCSKTRWLKVKTKQTKDAKSQD